MLSSKKVKLTALVFENTLFYFIVGVFIGRIITPYILLNVLTPILVGAAVVETLFYRHFVFDLDGPSDDLTRFHVFIETLMRAVIYFYAGYAFGRLL